MNPSAGLSSRHASGKHLVAPGVISWAALAFGSEACALASYDQVACTRPAVAIEQSARQFPAMLLAELEHAEAMGGEPRLAGSVLTAQEYGRFGAIGAIVCQLDGVRRTSTAFLVGRFDLAVTVAHVFDVNGHTIGPGSCFYANAGPFGQIRERIPVAYIKSQWQSEAGSYGRPMSDLAVVRLSAPVRLARRTLSLTRFDHLQAPAVLIGYGADLASDAVKRKVRGRVYPSSGNSCVRFTHDIDARNVASGAPVIDIQDNVVIGLHSRLQARLRGPTRCRAAGNALIVMSEWLEQTLRAEIAAGRITTQSRVTTRTKDAPALQGRGRAVRSPSAATD
jgi:hypothetical protein